MPDYVGEIYFHCDKESCKNWKCCSASGWEHASSDVQPTFNVEHKGDGVFEIECNEVEWGE